MCTGNPVFCSACFSSAVVHRPGSARCGGGPLELPNLACFFLLAHAAPWVICVPFSFWRVTDWYKHDEKVGKTFQNKSSFLSFTLLCWVFVFALIFWIEGVCIVAIPRMQLLFSVRRLISRTMTSDSFQDEIRVVQACSEIDIQRKKITELNNVDTRSHENRFMR